MVSRIGCAVVVLLLSGCASLGHLRPTATTRQPEDLVAGAAIATATVTAWPTDTWWTSFGDGQLDRLMERAVAGNPRLAAAQSRIEVAAALERAAGAALKPDVEGGIDFDYTRFSHDYYLPGAINGHDLLNPIWNNSAGATLTYHLDFWGSDRAALTAALDEVKVSECDARNSRLILEGLVIRAYAEFAYYFEIQDHENAILDTQRATLDLARRRLEAGLGTELETEQSENAVAATRARQVDVAERIEVIRHQLAALSGAGPGEGDTLVRPSMTVSHAVGLPSNLPAELIGRRPDVLAERWRVESAAQGIEVAKARFYPNVNLKASLGLLGLGFGNLVSLQAINATAGPAVTLPIFEGGKLRAGLDARIARYDIAVDAYNAVVVQALREVADQISELDSLSHLRVRREESLSHATRAHELARIAFEAGLTDYTNVLSTEDALSREENLMAEVGFKQIAAIASLNQALGGGLEHP